MVYHIITWQKVRKCKSGKSDHWAPVKNKRGLDCKLNILSAFLLNRTFPNFLKVFTWESLGSLKSSFSDSWPCSLQQPPLSFPPYHRQAQTSLVLVLHKSYLFYCISSSICSVKAWLKKCDGHLFPIKSSHLFNVSMHVCPSLPLSHMCQSFSSSSIIVIIMITKNPPQMVSLTLGARNPI